MTEEQLAALLRLQREAQPPPEYFDRLLQDVHRRQRKDVLELPLWKIAEERARIFLSGHGAGHFAFAGALILAVVSVIRLMPVSTELPGKAHVGTPPPTVAEGAPQDVIDARPVSYEPVSSFSF